MKRWRSWWPWVGGLVVLVLLWATSAIAGGESLRAAALALTDGNDGGGGGGGGGGALWLICALTILAVLGAPLFVIIAVIAALCFWLYGDGFDVLPCLSTSDQVICGYDVFPAKIADLTTKNVLLAIPFFVVSGAIMSAGDIANRLVEFTKALVGWLPGGLAIATVGGCIFFAAISGSSAVTVIAIGAMMVPALRNAGYKDKFAIGLVTTAGSLGILIPPSIPMLVFAIVAGNSAPIDVGELFLAGILPGLLIGVILALYSVVQDSRSPMEMAKGMFTLLGGVGVYACAIWLVSAIVPTWVLPVAHVVGLFGFCLFKQREAFWALLLPVLILGGIYSGLFTPTEAAAVSVIYALTIELLVHRQLTLAKIPAVIAEAAVTMGALLIIMALAFGLNDFLVQAKIPDLAVAKIEEMNLSTVQFLLMVNVFLLAVGACMDAISAILVVVPLLAPIAIRMGIDPIHLGVMFIVNLEIGYLTPPIGINLFVASAAFKRSIGDVVRAVVPFIALMLVGLGLVTYVPTLSLGPVNVMLRDRPFYVPLLDDPAEGPEPRVVGDPSADSAEVRSMAEITQLTADLQSLCYVAEDVVDDDEVAVSDRASVWLKRLEDEDLADPDVVAHAEATAHTDDPELAYRTLQQAASTMLGLKWACPALATMLGVDTGPTAAQGTGGR